MRSFSLVGLVFILVLSGCAEPKSFEIKSVKSFKVEKLGIKENVFNAQLECYNPNNFGVIVKKIDCDIFINDKKLTHYLLDTNIEVPAASNFMLPAKVEIALSSILTYSVDIMFNKPFKIVIHLGLRFYIYYFFISFLVLFYCDSSKFYFFDNFFVRFTLLLTNNHH